MLGKRVDTDGDGKADTLLSTHLMSLLVRAGALVWSAGMLTMVYMGNKTFDATFIASVFSGTLATFGVELTNRNKEKPSPPRDPNK